MLHMYTTYLAGGDPLDVQGAPRSPDVVLAGAVAISGISLSIRIIMMMMIIISSISNSIMTNTVINIIIIIMIIYYYHHYHY